jgi:N-acetylmuramic acid 6-phosphate (MurNAc-6-P) etherase
VLQIGYVKGKEKVEQSVPGGEDAQSSVAKEVIKIGNYDVVMGIASKGQSS